MICIDAEGRLGENLLVVEMSVVQMRKWEQVVEVGMRLCVWASRDASASVRWPWPSKGP